jgi:hypothetical protein
VEESELFNGNKPVDYWFLTVLEIYKQEQTVIVMTSPYFIAPGQKLVKYLEKSTTSQSTSVLSVK